MYTYIRKRVSTIKVGFIKFSGITPFVKESKKTPSSKIGLIKDYPCISLKDHGFLLISNSLDL